MGQKQICYKPTEVKESKDIANLRQKKESSSNLIDPNSSVDLTNF